MLMQFQLTASRRGWLNDATKDTDNNLFQLTASRRGWQRVNQCSVWVFNISTHSLTKRLTINDFNEHPINLFQLTASRRGWRQRSLSSVFRSGYFNSQPHEEADGSPVRADCNWNISTHSLTKRLTERRYIWLTSYMYFNSQPHEEADNRTAEDVQASVYFNSQPHEEADNYTTVSLPQDSHFNSQPHEEADCIRMYLLIRFMKFQLTASRRGWRRPSTIFCNAVNISTHSLTKRLTLSAVNVPELISFQLTASRRGWHQPEMERFRWRTFQLTASRRGWLVWTDIVFELLHISTHSLTKRLTTNFSDCEYDRIFQLTASRRGWQVALGGFQSYQQISTHSLTKRLTPIYSYTSRIFTFQLTASRRGWRTVLHNRIFEDLFQLTASRRGWLP